MGSVPNLLQEAQARDLVWESRPMPRKEWPWTQLHVGVCDALWNLICLRHGGCPLTFLHCCRKSRSHMTPTKGLAQLRLSTSSHGIDGHRRHQGYYLESDLEILLISSHKQYLVGPWARGTHQYGLSRTVTSYIPPHRQVWHNSPIQLKPSED